MEKSHDRSADPRATQARPPKPKPKSPIEVAIISWFEQLPSEISELIASSVDNLISSAPKRWVVYPPMVLLPSGSFDEEWWQHPFKNTPHHRDALWVSILQHITKREGKGTLTHLAINSGIPLHRHPAQSSAENILRTPSGLVTLHGDFGPALAPDRFPSGADFEQAFWVSTKQNGITQIWAPRYTMFSRGNIKEKARILDFHDQAGAKEIGSRVVGKERLGGATAIDLYAGIGYFVFSYVKMGLKRVVGWELNPWSVEGLRRGAVANGWGVKVVVGSGQEIEIGDEKIVVFLEDNRKANARREALGLDGVIHVNCGLLPASEDSWQTALGFLTAVGWLHLHENVGVNDIQTRRSEIEVKFTEWLHDMGDERIAVVEHVELVKTFAPGVWHCVFDVYLKPASLDAAIDVSVSRFT